MRAAGSGRPLRDPNGERLSTALISYVRLADDLPRREPHRVSPLDGPRGLIPDHQWGASRHPGILSRHDTDGCIRVFLLHLFLLLIQRTSTMARSGRQREGIRERNPRPIEINRSKAISSCLFGAIKNINEN